MLIRVTVWNEFRHELNNEKVKAIYPQGIHMAIKSFLDEEGDFLVNTTTLDSEENGITQRILDNTDVLIWWGHKAHKEVPDEKAAMVQQAVLSGMGFVALHSAHHSKPFKALMGTSCNLGWREEGDMERLWVIKPSHPIAQGLSRYFELPQEETYAEPFDIPEPEQCVFGGWYEGGEIFRSGCCFFRGNGKIFYFQPGHETYPVYYDKNIQLIIKNAVRWAKPSYRTQITCSHIKKIDSNLFEEKIW